MPNRILKESICTSSEVDVLTWQQEVFFYRLIVNCDDYGRMDARPAILRARCFPLRLEKISAKDIDGYLKALCEAGLIQVYKTEGNLYLQVSTWEKHQQVRAKKSKYPAPDGNLQANDINGYQMISGAPVIQSNPNPKERYGELQNVLLTDEELGKLKERFPIDYLDKIENLSQSLASHGYKYVSHYATILNWARRDKVKSADPGPGVPEV